jgi:hypothetical protein
MAFHVEDSELAHVKVVLNVLSIRLQEACGSKALDVLKANSAINLFRGCLKSLRHKTVYLYVDVII